MTSTTSLGLVLSGGGALGAFEAGVIAGLEEAGLRPDVFSGTSAGALNVAGLAAGFDAARLAELWLELRDRDVFRVRADVLRLLRPGALLARTGSVVDRVLEGIGWAWLLDTEPLRKTLIRVFGSEVLPRCDDRPAVVSAVELATGNLVRFASHEPLRPAKSFRVVDLRVDHLLASAAIPMLFRPAAVDGALYWDGGLVANTPLSPVLSYLPDRVIVVTTSALVRPAKEPESMAEAAALLVESVLGHSLTADLAHADSVNKACAKGVSERDDYKVVDFLTITPGDFDVDLAAPLNFDPAQAELLIAHGRMRAAEALLDW